MTPTAPRRAKRRASRRAQRAASTRGPTSPVPSRCAPILAHSRRSVPWRRCSAHNQLGELPLPRPGPPLRSSADRWPRRNPKPSRASRGKFASRPPACSGRRRVPRQSSSRSRASMRPARRRHCRRRTTARCSTSWRRRSPPTASPARRRCSTSSSAPRASASRSAAMTCASCSTSSARPIRGSTRAPRRTCSPPAFATSSWRAAADKGFNLSADELDLIEAWFAAPIAQRGGAAAAAAQGGHTPSRQPQQGMTGFGPTQDRAAPGPGPAQNPDRWWSQDDGRRPGQEQPTGTGGDEFPRIIRTRLRG